MTARFHLCLWLAALLVSCDKPRDTGDHAAANESKHQVTHAARPPHEHTASTPTELRKSMSTALKIVSPGERDEALAEVALDALETEPEIAAAAFKQISTDSEARLPLIQSFAMQLLEQDPQKALAWADSLASEQEIAAAKQMIVHSLHDADLEGAAKSLAKSGLASTEPESPGMYVLQRWTTDAPADAAAWVGSLPAGESRNVGLAAVASQWVVADSQAALAWMAGLNSPAERSKATHAMAEALMKQPPPIREAMLEPADPATLRLLEQEVEAITRDLEKATPPPAEDEPPAE